MFVSTESALFAAMKVLWHAEAFFAVLKDRNSDVKLIVIFVGVEGILTIFSEE